jgi:DNA-binding NtrC family response regulator
VVSDETTGSMERARHLRAAAKAGLVLLYAPPDVAAPHFVEIGEQGVVLGRSPPLGGVILPQGAVSRVHTRITLEAEGIVLSDLGSRNGTFVGGVPVTRAVLERNDVVRIGDVFFKLAIDDAEAYRLQPPRGGDLYPDLVGGPLVRALKTRMSVAAVAGLPCLVLGETGTGKELVAKAFHAACGRLGPFVPVNCAAIAPHLVESELFGYRRGAFTGAERDHLGLMRSANGGTLFLDEIGDMPLEAQAKLLRVLESREVLAVGSVKSEPIDIQLVCATHASIPSLVHAGRFRADLYARINVCTLLVPALRDRLEDVAPLLRHFAAKHGRPGLLPTTALMTALLHHDWPYNVRELEGLVRRCAAFAEASATTLDHAHLPPELLAKTSPFEASVRSSRPSIVADEEAPVSRRPSPSREELCGVLAETNGNLAAVARHYGKDRTQIHRWLRQYDIDPETFRAP